METFKKRQREMRRLDKARDKAAKRKEQKERKALGIVTPDESTADEGTAVPEDAPTSPAEADAPLTN